MVNKPFLYIIVLTVWLLLSYLSLLLDMEIVRALTHEDSYFESFGAFCLFFSMFCFFYLFCKDRRPHRIFGRTFNKNIFLFALACVFLFGACEEISWGQRILNFSTPEVFNANMQGESNIHNLPSLDMFNKEGVLKTDSSRYFTIAYIYKVFWFIWCCLVPVLCRFSVSMKKCMDDMGIPIVPIWIGVFFLLNYFVFLEVNDMVHLLLKWPVGEIYEGVSEFLFAVLACWFVVQYNAGNSGQQSEVE